MVVDSFGRKELQRIQSQRLSDILQHALERSPFYQKKYAQIRQQKFSLEQIPVVTKTELMENFGEWVTDPRVQLSEVLKFIKDPENIAQLYLNEYTVWESSGSSGVPGVFLQSKALMSIYDALEFSRKSTFLKARQFLTPCALTDKVAFVGVTSGHFASIVSFLRMQAHAPYLKNHFRSFSILASRPDLIDELNQFKPVILVTYPTAAIALAGAQERGELCLDLDEILVGGEDLKPAMRDYLKLVFKCKVINSYGASEFLPIAWECDDGRLHVNADWLILEPVDENYQPVPPGTLSHTTLLTHLANYTQPLIRYDLGDSLRVEHRPCSCGCRLPTIELEGRSDDILVLQKTDGQCVEILPLALATLLEEELGLFDFQICQTGPRKLSVVLPMEEAEGHELMQRCKALLRCYFEREGVNSVHFVEKYGGHRVLGRSGKVKRILSQQRSA